MVHSARRKSKKTVKKRGIYIWKFNAAATEEAFNDHYGLVDLLTRAFESYDRIIKAFNETSEPIEEDIKISDHLLYFINKKLLSAYSPENEPNVKHEIKESIHSIFFYSILKNCGYECKKADEYYEVLEGGFPQMTWPLYLKLLGDCQLNDFFVQCMLGIPNPIAECLLREVFLELKKNDYDNDWTLCNSLVQIVIIKILGAVKLFSNMPFDFPFSKTENTSLAGNNNSENRIIAENGNSEENSSNENVLDRILQETINYLQTFNNAEKLAPILLSGLITIFESLSDYKDDEFNAKLEELEKFFSFAKDYFESKEVLDFLVTQFKTFNYFQFVPNFTTRERYEWHCGYLVFLTYIKWTDIKRIPGKQDYGETYRTIDNTVEFLFSHHPLYTADTSITEQYVPMMISQVKMKLDGFDFAIDYFFKNESFLKRTEILSCLKEIEFNVKKKRERYFQLMNATFTASDPERTELFHMFLQWYEHADLPLKKDLMQVRVSEYKCNMKTPSYKKDLLNFSNFTPGSDDKVTSRLLYLCMQSIEDTIERIVGDVISYGKTKLALIEGLKDIPYVCTYQKPSSESGLPILIEAIKPYFKASNKGQILVILTETFIKMFPDSAAFPRHHFVSSCILEFFSSNLEENDMRFYCELLHIILMDSLNGGDVMWMNSISVSVLMEKLISSLHWAICHANISLKEDILDIFNILLKLDNKDVFENFYTTESQQRLLEFLETKHPNVKFYMLDFLMDRNIDITSLTLDKLFSYCIIRNEHDALIKYASHHGIQQYPDIISATAQVLSYFSSEEVASLLGLLKTIDIPQNNDDEESETSSSDQQKLVIAIKVLADAVHSINSCKPVENVFVLHNFSSTINSQWINLRSDPLAFKSVFLEITKLSLCLPDYSDIFNATLLMFAEEFDWTKVDSLDREKFSKDFCTTLEKLTDNDCRKQLLRFFTIPEKTSAEQKSS